MHFKSDVGSGPPPFKCVVMWTPALGRVKENIVIDIEYDYRNDSKCGDPDTDSINLYESQKILWSKFFTIRCKK